MFGIPALASFGGGGFLLAVPAGGRPRVYDFFVHTPKRRLPGDAVEFEPIFIDFGTSRQEFHIGRGTVAVPGMVRGFFDVHRDLCTMRAADLVAPACTLLRDGVEITGLQAHFLHLLRPILAATPESLALYRSGRGDGALLGEGDPGHRHRPEQHAGRGGPQPRRLPSLAARSPHDLDDGPDRAAVAGRP